MVLLTVEDRRGGLVAFSRAGLHRPFSSQRMNSFLRQIFDTSDFPARWHCGLWSEGHGWLHISSDLAIFGAYAAIPIALIYFIRQRRDMPFPPLIWLFAAFIFSCGFGHLIEATIFWQPWYRFSGLVKAFTAIVSWLTVVALVRLLPQALALPGLAQVNRQLESEINERKRSETALRASEERFRQLADNVTEVFWLSDPAKKEILYVSPAYEKIWGRSCQSLYKSPRAWLDAVHHDDRTRILQAALERQVSGNYDEQYRIVQPDGSERWIHDRAFPVRDSNGTVVRIAGVAEDITSHKQAQADRDQLEAQLRQVQKMDAVGTLAGGIAHDFNNILGAIIGNTQLAIMDLAADHPARKSLDEVKKAGARAKALVMQILAFARQQPQEREVVELVPVLEDVVKLARATLPASVELVLQCEPGSTSVRADVTQIHQIVLNLCTNAWQAMEGQPGRIDLRLERVQVDADLVRSHPNLQPGRHARISVTDTGKGMDAATLERIFEPFFTTKGPGQGTGLGLSVVHGIMRLHQGTITVQSAPGSGTRFDLYFPTVTPATQPRFTPPSQLAHGSGQHVLYLDDEEQLVFLTTRVLQRSGYRVSGFSRPSEALAAFRAQPDQFDLVVTDYNMPGMSGLQVASELLKLRPDLPVVLASGYLTDELRAEAALTGIRHTLYKPETVEGLCNAVHQFLGQRNPTRATPDPSPVAQGGNGF
jgi:PAS domain S-box-containing protein